MGHRNCMASKCYRGYQYIVGADQLCRLINTFYSKYEYEKTDGPFAMTADRPSKPVDVALVTEALGQLQGLPATTILERVRKNLHNLLL